MLSGFRRLFWQSASPVLNRRTSEFRDRKDLGVIVESSNLCLQGFEVTGVRVGVASGGYTLPELPGAVPVSVRRLRNMTVNLAAPQNLLEALVHL